MSGPESVWVELTAAHALAADEQALRHNRIGAGTGHRWTPTSKPELLRTYHARCELAAAVYLGATPPPGVVVRSTPNATGRFWPRFEDVDQDVVIGARGPFLRAPGRTLETRTRGRRDGHDLRWVELRGWIAGHRIEHVGERAGGGYKIPPEYIEPMETLRDYLDVLAGARG